MDKCGKECNNQPQMSADQMKKLQEMMKNKAKSIDCPYIKTCTNKVLKEEWEILCKDAEKIQEVAMLHMRQRHASEMCKVFQETKKEREGKHPKDWS